MEWLPIESAPKTGEKIVVVWLGRLDVAFWNKEVQNWQEWPDGDFDNGGEVTQWLMEETKEESK